MVVERSAGMRLAAAPAHSPEEGIALAEEHRPDVVLMDIVFKGSMNGIEATRKIKELSPATKVATITAPPHRGVDSAPARRRAAPRRRRGGRRVRVPRQGRGRRRGPRSRARRRRG